MSVEIFYFSGTGNSLAVARDLARQLDAKLTSIPGLTGQERVTTDADTIGIVFPVYNVGITYVPLVVQRFVSKLAELDDKYIFGVCTYGGGYGQTLRVLDNLVRARGGRLSAGFGVQMPQNAFVKPFEDKQKCFDGWKRQKLAKITAVVSDKREYFEAEALLSRLVIGLLLPLIGARFMRPVFLRPMYLAAGYAQCPEMDGNSLIHEMDKSYIAGDRCNGCGTCARVCPVSNIVLDGGRPVWQHRCETCLACVKWCPRQAISGFGDAPKGYHHPEVTLADMVRKTR